MHTSRDSPHPAGGLRERKKVKTRAAIQREAMRLFREQGYEATTVDQIVEQVEISPSTFFRYFPTKEDVVLYDNLDPLMMAAFEAQPLDVPVMQAMRAAMHEVFAELTQDEIADIRDRIVLIAAVPELRARVLDEIIRTLQMFTPTVAKRQGRPENDFAVLVFTGAIIGVAMSVMLAIMNDPNQDFVALLDAALTQLESGISL